MWRFMKSGSWLSGVGRNNLDNIDLDNWNGYSLFLLLLMFEMFIVFRGLDQSEEGM
jgi:hypothetical protein